MKHQTYIAFLFTLATFFACESPDIPLQRPDRYADIVFSAQPQKRLTRQTSLTRTNPYEAYDSQRHPGSMGAFGFQDLSQSAALSGGAADANAVYFNERATHDAATLSWTTAVPKRWADYPAATSFDFFAYMPHTDGATLVRTATDTYTLSFPFSMSNGAAAPVIFNQTDAPIICALPNHKEDMMADGADRVVDFKFDQTLTAYRLLFILDTKMNAIRHFRIKRVSLSGTLATSCTISRTYTWQADKQRWSAASIAWTNLRRQAFVETPFLLPYEGHGTAAYDDNTQTAVVTADATTQWGRDFYTIPDAQFQPVIQVTYDVELTAQDGTTLVTRKDVTSSIALSKTNFSQLATGKTAMLNPIRILIQPRYLYVLADQDAYTGHLLID